jgi:sigma-B regulation protein RsbU (phosphoserine phosphatase)
MPLASTTSLQRFWNRRSGLARITLYCLLAYGLLTLLRRTVLPAIGGWSTFAGFICLVLALVLGSRWLRTEFMWRLRNRLIVTYIFIGVIPVLLLATMAGIAGWGFASQFATYVISSDLRAEQRAVRSANDTLFNNLAEQIRAGAKPTTALQLLTPPANSDMHVAAFVNGPTGPVRNAVPPASAIDSVPPHVFARMKNGAFEGIVEHGENLYLRSIRVADLGPQKLTVLTSLPFDRTLLQHITGNMGQVTLFRPDLRPGAQKQASASREPANTSEPRQPSTRAGGLEVSPDNISWNAGDTSNPSPAITAGSIPPPAARWDRQLGFVTTIEIIGWDSPATGTALIAVQSRPSLLYTRVADTLGQLGGTVVIALIAVAIVFAVIELLALLIGVRLTRTVTASVHKLYQATQSINRGDFTHRIVVESRDQLAALETSFNSMTQSLELLIEEQKEKQRIESELAIAQEVQAQLFPRKVVPLRTLEVFGVCLPARTVSGDYYDFLPLGAEKIGIAMGDISGKGISAALLMATIHSAVRVYEFGRAPSREQLVAAGASAISATAGASSLATATNESPAHVLELLNAHLYHSTPPEKYATMFLGVWDGTSHRLTYSNAGHLPPFVVCKDGSVSKLEAGGTVIGLFDNCRYDEDAVQLKPGDLFVAYSDGLTEPENEFGEFGEERLLELLTTNRTEPLEQIAEAVTSAINDWIGAAEQPDDVTLVLARAR